ncbi:hypothetical protein H9Q70_014580 [Fusarium xylarioides]|nr:hypothetical protein H9Q70_014580 [Fusarium xylarioides]
MPIVRRSLQFDPDKPDPAAFGCEILLLVHRLYRQDPPIIKELKELNELKGKLLGGIHIRYEELVFIDALRDDMYDEWFEAIRDQVRRVLKKTEPQLL